MDRRDFPKSAFTLAVLAPLAKLHAKAGVGCVACLKKCPQRLDIPRYMKQIAGEFN